MPTISIVVPIFNIENYLADCIDSILAQTFKNFELILVDDGSTDKSKQICDQYSEMDNRIRVIHKTNGGVSSARNIGIDIARGEFISFVDPDDTIEPNMYEELLKKAIEFNVDIVICPIRTINYKNNTVSVSTIWGKGNSIIDKKAIEEYLIPSILIEKTYSLVSSVNKLYKKSLFENLKIKFEEQKNHSEDARLNFTLLTLINNLLYVERPLYNYHVRQRDSLTQIFRENFYEYALDNKQFLVNLCKKYNLEKYIENITNHFTEVILGHMQDLVNRKIPEKKKYILLNKILNNEEFMNDILIYRTPYIYYKVLRKICMKKNETLFYKVVKVKTKFKYYIEKVV